MSGRIIIIAGWAHAAEDLSALCSLLSAKYDVQATSTARLFSKVDPGLQSLPPASHYAKALSGIISRSKEPLTLVAWSMGAIVAIEAITKFSLKIRNLVLVNGTARFCAAADYPHGIPEKNLRAMTTGLTKRPDEILTSFFHDAIFPETDKTQIVEKKTRRALSQSIDCLRDGLVYLRRTDLRCELPKINTSTLIVHGNQDRIIPVSAGKFLHDNIADSHLVTHDNAGHTLMLDHPTMIAEDIRTFVEA